MATKSIVDYLGVRDSRPTPDLIFDAAAVPQNTSATSDAVNLGKTQAGLEIVVYADTAVVLGASAVMTVEYLYGDSFAESITLYSVTAAVGGSTIAAGELARFVPTTDLPVEGKIKIETDDATATGSISVWPEYVAR